MFAPPHATAPSSATHAPSRCTIGTSSEIGIPIGRPDWAASYACTPRLRRNSCRVGLKIRQPPVGIVRSAIPARGSYARIQRAVQDLIIRNQLGNAMTTPNSHMQVPEPLPVQMYGMLNAHLLVQALHVAATLGIADLLADGPKSVEELAQASSSHAPSLYRLLRLLAGAGVFAEDESGRFMLTPLAATLRTDTPDSVL